jgi:L,D-peptidoglycan transpeptidase YkuD (ErfK/YbiS/YcfS/YnhG family)
MKLNFILLTSLLFIACSQNNNEVTEKNTVPTTKESFDTLKVDELESFILLSDSISSSSEQIILVYNDTPSNTVGKLIGFEKADGDWQKNFNSSTVNIGKNGFASKGKKREGDGKTPSGIFKIGSAFGYENHLESEVSFIKLNDNHYWISNPESDDYNKLVEYISSDRQDEKMRRNDHLYKYGIIIRYNMDEVVKNLGSAIFIHVERRKGAPTAGCVSFEEERMVELIKWLRPGKNPIIIMGTQKEIFSRTD